MAVGVFDRASERFERYIEARPQSRVGLAIEEYFGSLSRVGGYWGVHLYELIIGHIANERTKVAICIWGPNELTASQQDAEREQSGSYFRMREAMSGLVAVSEHRFLGAGWERIKDNFEEDQRRKIFYLKDIRRI